ncbi:MAG: putative Ig domain-containing protein, partial [bacterium]
NPDPGNISRILLAVSKTATPTSATAADWYYHAIDAKETIAGVELWADYPGFEVDEEAIYVTANMFEFAGGPDLNFDVQLWIVDKGVVGGFYGGGPASVTVHQPYTAAGYAGSEGTTMPALVYGAGGVGPGIGTFLVQYDGWTWGGSGGLESLLVIRVDDPLGAPTFTADFVDFGDIEDIGGAFGWPDLPDAPQLGTSTDIEVNDRRTLDAVWRNNRLWLTTTIIPNSGPDAGQTTAYWIKLNTSAWPPTVDDQGYIGGDDIHPAGDVFTFFPSVAVNNGGDAYFGFSASSAAMYAGAYCAGRQAGDPAGTVRATETVGAGLDYYIRTFGTPGVDENRWGDYSGISLDPTDDDVFWVFNEYAMTRGTPFDGEDGRWGTAWASAGIVSIAGVPDVEAGDDKIGEAGSDLKISFDLTNTGTVADSFEVAVTDERGWILNPNSLTVALEPGAESNVAITSTVPEAESEGIVNTITFTATSRSDPSIDDSDGLTITVAARMLPTMEPIAEPQAQWHNEAPSFSNFGFDDNVDLDKGWYQMNSCTGPWTPLFTDIAGTWWDNDGWIIPGFGDLPQGSNTIYFKAEDDAGNVGGGCAWNWQFYKDTMPPTFGTIAINSGADTTTSAMVSLDDLSAVDTLSGMASGAQMRFSNDGTLWSAAEDYESMRAGWDLTEPEYGGDPFDGMKTVYVQFRDVAGNWSDSFGDSIFYSPPVTVMTSFLSDGFVGSAYSETLLAVGGTPPYVWSMSSGALPDGLSLDSLAGAISGTPATAGTTYFTVEVTDAKQATDTQDLSLTIYMGLKGDVNGDGQVNIVDALLAVNILLEVMAPTTLEYWAADCNGDGVVNIVDVLGIVNVVLGIGTCDGRFEIRPQ